MATFNASDATVTVYTFKDGLLSKVAHDLQVSATSFSINADTQNISAQLDPRSFRVDHCMKQGKPAHGTLSAGDKKKIEGNIVKDVLNSRRFPQITFVSTEVTKDGDNFSIKGELSLHGKKRSLNISARRQGDRLCAEFWIHQPDFGIRSFKALMGAIKVKPDVKIVVSTPADL